MFMTRSKQRGRGPMLVGLLALVSLVAVAYAQVGGIFPTVLIANNTTGSRNGQIVVNARLTRFFGGAPISAQRLQPYIMRDGGSTTLGPVYTDSNGYARLTLQRGQLPAGNYAIGWQYDGNGVYSRPLAVSSVTVTP